MRWTTGLALILLVMLPFLGQAQTHPDSLDYSIIPSFMIDYAASSSEVLTHHELLLVNRRMEAVVETHNAEDVDSLTAEALSYSLLAELPYAWRFDNFDWTMRHENAFLHSSGPASAIAFAGSTGVELRWKKDLRFDDLMTDTIFESPIDSFFVYRATDMPPGEWELLTPEPLHSQQWLDETMTIGQDYRYIIKSAFADSSLEYSRELSITYNGPSWEAVCWPLDAWVEEAPADSVLTLHVEFAVYPDTSTLSPGIVVDTNRDLDFTADDSLSIAVPVSGSPGLYHAEMAIPNDPGFYGGHSYGIFLDESLPLDFQAPEQGCYLTGINNRIRAPRYPLFYMDPGNEDWLYAWLWIANDALSRGYDGLYADDATPFLRRWNVDASPLGYSDESYNTEIRWMLSQIKTALPSASLYVNGMRSDEGVELLDIVDGCMHEGFPYNSWQYKMGDNDWAAAFNLILKAVEDYDKLVMVSSEAPDSLTEERIYSLASFLLAAGEGAVYFNCTEYRDRVTYYAEQQLLMGAALEVLDPLPDDELNSLPMVREYENGWVVVNPKSNGDPLSYTPNSTCHRVAIDGKRLMQGGLLWTEEQSGPVELPPLSAVILMKEAIASPHLESPPAGNILLADGNTIFPIAVRAWHSTPLWIEMDANALGGSTHLRLLDDGSGLDVAAGDSIYTAIDTFLLSVDTATGIYRLPCLAQGDDGFAVYDSVDVQVLPRNLDNLIQNYSFEWAEGSQPWQWTLQGPVAWTMEEASEGTKSVLVTADEQFSFGTALQTVETTGFSGGSLHLVAHSQAEEVTGGSGEFDNSYSVLLQGGILEGGIWGPHYLRFSSAQEGWQERDTLFTDVPHLSSLNLICSFGHPLSGRVYYDEITLSGVNATGLPHEDSPLPFDFALGHNFPNPFNPSTRIPFTLGKRATVLLRVFDLKGREIQTLVNGVLEAGSYEALWDGRNKDARPMASGIYFLRLEQGKRVASRKLLLLK